MGYAGQVSLGHAGFAGLAAYTTAILTTNHGLPVAAGIGAAVLLTGVVAALVGIPTLKLRGHYLAMGTLGVGVIVTIVLNEATDLTGGPSGLPGIPRLSVAGATVSTDRGFAHVAWGTAFLLFVLARNLVRSRAGRALRAIPTSEAAASVLGVDVAKYKRFVFVVSALYAAVSGALYAHYVTFVSPGTFSFHASVQYVTMVVLGGMSSLWGALLGAVFLTVLPEFLRAIENYDIVIYGAILLACTLFLRGGIAGVGEALLRAFRRAPAARGEEKP
jgi:branched-chain amino acid transport system permease protein